MSHWLGPTLLAPPLSMVWQVKQSFWKSSLPCSTLALASLGPIGGSSAAAGAAAVSVDAPSATAMAGFSRCSGETTALDTLPTTIAKSADARKQPATVLKLAIVDPAAPDLSDAAVARPE